MRYRSRALPLALAAALAATTAARCEDEPKIATPPAIATFQDLAFAALAPCRALDTRTAGGALVAGGPPLALDLTGGACGVAPEAKAVLVNLAAVGAAGVGNLRAWPWDASAPAQPNASVLNYTSGFNSANAVVLPVCNPGTATGNDCSFDLFVQANLHDTELVVDVLGYFASPGLGPRWGAGRPDAAVWGTGGLALGLCSNGGVAFGLSRDVVPWGSSAEVCPHGTWVCTAAQRGTGACDTARPQTVAQLTCAGDPLPEGGPSGALGWTADAAHTDGKPAAVYEDGATFALPVCSSLPVWCCALP